MRIGGGGGYGAITGRTYTIKTMAVTQDSASGYTAPEIEELFSYLDPGAAAQAGAAHTAAGQTLASIADDLVKHVQVLNENWSGTSAQSALGSFQQLHQTAVGLAQASAQTGAVLSWLGETILPYYKNYKAPGNGIVGDLESLVGHNPQNSAAQAVMERLNNRFTQANAGLPSSVSVSLPASLGGHSSATTSSVGSAGAGAGQAASGVSGLAGGGGGVGSLAGGGVGAGTGVGGAVGGLGRGSSGSVTHLASYSPPGGSSGSGAGAGQGGGLAGGTMGSGGQGGGLAGGTMGSGAPGSGPPGPGGSLFPVSGGSGPGGGAEGPGALGNTGGDGLGGDGAALNGEGMASEGMVGVAPGDSAVMGADGMIGMAPDPGAEGLGGGLADGGIGVGDAAAAGTVGADGAMAGDAAGSGMTGLPMMGSAAGRQESERRRQAWMAEDADVWEAEADLVPALIGA
jgi:uncharacterized protein YukE